MLAPSSKIISRADYLRLDGLLVQARQIRGDLERIRQAACAITGEPDGGRTDEAVLRADAGITVPLLQLLGIQVADAPSPAIDQWSASHAIVARPEQHRSGDERSAACAETNSIFTLDGLGRPYLITELVEFNEDGTDTSERRRSFSLADGTPVVQIAQGCYRTAGRLPFVDLFSADADPRHLRYVSPPKHTGDPGWSGTDTAPLRSPIIQNS